ncbi:glycosyltransferase [Aneurinibacillus sp. REN35]|uniref:glycosyltransferase n=2 Tax=Paenibacillaceae TaxID=186822 RepID=UPI00352892B8
MEQDQQIYNELKTIKSKIEKFIYNGNFEEARQAIYKYEQINPDDIDVYSLKAVICLLEQKFDEAKLILTEGLRQASFHPDLIFNLAYTHEQQQNYQQAYELYYDAAELFDDENKKDEARQASKRIEEQQPSLVQKKKIAFFVKQGMDSFLGSVISGLERDYRVIKIEVTELSQINEAMKWADICWFEWCDELIIYASNIEIAQEKKIICRIHGYEVYTPNITKVNWNLVDQLIVVAPHILKLFKAKINTDKLKSTKINLVYCGVEVSKYPFKEKNRGFNIGYLGYINFKKNLPLTLDIFLKLYSKDKRYKLFLAGEFQDERTYRYIEFFVNEHNLKDNIVFEGWKDHENKIKWFEKINYILISSIDEGLCYAAAESMLSGIKPILHNCEGLKDHYPADYLFNTLEEAIEKIEEDEYKSKEYRSFIETNYASDKQNEVLLNIIMNLLQESSSRTC